MYQASRRISRPCYCCRRFGGGNLNGVGVGGCCYRCHGAVWLYIVAGVATLRLCAMVVVVAIHVVVAVRR
jgi:hypothetical protein